MEKTLKKEFDATDIKNLQLETFAGDIEIIGHEENTIIVEIFATVRSWTSLFLSVDSVNFFDSEINHLAFKTIDETLDIFSKPNYFHPYNWFNFQKTSFRVFLPKTINANSKTYGGNIHLKELNANHDFTTWGGDIRIDARRSGGHSSQQALQARGP